MRLPLLAFAAALSCASASSDGPLDLVLSNGRVIDGTGAYRTEKPFAPRIPFD